MLLKITTFSICHLDFAFNKRFIIFYLVCRLSNTRFITVCFLFKTISFLPMLMNSNKAQTENEAEDDKTEESENSGKAVTNMLKQVTISRKSRLNFYLD